MFGACSSDRVTSKFDHVNNLTCAREVRDNNFATNVHNNELVDEHPTLTQHARNKAKKARDTRDAADEETVLVIPIERSNKRTSRSFLHITVKIRIEGELISGVEKLN